MGKYGMLQLRRVARYVPFGLCVVLVLFGCVGIVYQAMGAAREAEDAENAAKLRVGVVGTAGDQYLQWGLAAMQFDSSALSIQMVQMEEAQAIAALEQGDIAAFVVFPEGFVSGAMHGNVGQLRFVSTAGAAGLVSIIKEEVTQVIDGILTACESGSYAVGDALKDNGYGSLQNQHIGDLALEYVDFLFDRSKMYRVESLVQENTLPLDRYLLGGLTVLLLMLGALPFGPLYIQQELSLQRLLRARGLGAAGQVLSELGSLFAGMTALLAAVSAMLALTGLLPQGTSGWSVFSGALPVLWMVAAMCYLLFSLSDQLMGGLLLTFFAILALCFAGGCLYPSYVFPVSLQRMAAWLPSSLARQRVTACIQGETPTGLAAVLGYGAGFLALAVAVRSRRIRR